MVYHSKLHLFRLQQFELVPYTIESLENMLYLWVTSFRHYYLATPLFAFCFAYLNVMSGIQKPELFRYCVFYI